MKIIVSGFPRSGTSMMMGALIEGGVPPYYDEVRQHHMMNRDDYTPNKHGFWEVGSERFMKLGFTTDVPDRHCVKIQAIGLPILTGDASYKIILMRRDPDLIKESYQAAFPGEIFEHKYPNWPDYYWNLMDNIKGIMGQRRDVELLELWMNDVIKDPKGSMERIKAMGIKLDVAKAAASIDPELERFKCA